MRTGENAPELGLYISNCCDYEAIFDLNDCLTRCMKCSSLCLWDLEEKLVSMDELEATESQVEVA